MEIKDFYTARETLAILAIGHTTLERWTRLGTIKSVKKGTARLYPRKEIMFLLGPRRWREEIEGTPAVEVKVQGRRSSYPVRKRGQGDSRG